MINSYYAVCFVVEDKSNYMIYIDTANSSMMYCVTDQVLLFSELDDLFTFALDNDIVIDPNDEVVIYDFDDLKLIVERMEEKVDCSLTIDFWNIIDDICNGLSISFIGKSKYVDYIYNKLFRGCNTAANTFEYNHTWSEQEVKIIKSVLEECIWIASNVVKKVAF
ncbi:hypothetical protein OAO42_01835 [Candidatus Izimaplasma bacterium]|nr:hypothetical protein [Candidatus Izimaplasma bacterium]